MPTTPNQDESCDSDLAEQTLQYLWDAAESSLGEQMQQVIATGKVLKFEYSLSMCGQDVWFLANISPISDQTVLWVARDISDRKRLEQELFQEKELAQVTLQSIGDAVITTDVHGQIQNINPVAEHLTGWTLDEAKGKPLPEIFNIIHETTREPAENPVQQALREGRIVALANHTVLISREGTEYGIEDSAAPIRDRQGQVVGAVMVFHDVTQSRSLNHQLSWQASHDPLTRLANRRKFDQTLQDAFQAVQQDNPKHVLCFLDLDRFKVINDTCGHAAGDELLCQVAQLLQQSIRASDTVARLGGDEFGILLTQCPLEKAEAIAEQLRQAIQAFRFQWAGKTFSIGVSIGLVPLDSESLKIEDVLGAADAACYAAKAKGRNQIKVTKPMTQS
ncbi:MAG: diguanylate cyclase [Acaryochloridaceae cyanobacterium SU_2_1]|nr:diguanylate cyclase [Acaryochloridaceae cyanobacterium SU_2_1]